MNAVVETRELTKVFDGRAVVNRAELSVPKATIYGIVGANGAGKSTLLRMLIGLYRPSFGEISLLGKSLTERDVTVRQRVHYVGTDVELPRAFRVRELLTYASLLYENWDQKRCDILLDALSLPRGQLIRNLSTGMKAQLRLALALSARPELLILDEPTNGLDPVVKRQMLQLIVQEAAQGTTVIIATHQLDDLDRIADGVVMMFQGKVVASGMIDQLKHSVKEIQVVMPQRLPPAFEQHPQIIHVERKGQLYTLRVEGEISPFVAQLKEVGATYVEVFDVGIDQLFHHVMGKEGYTRDGILLP